MTRRIIYILLAVLLVLVLILGIRWWINQNGNEDTVAEEVAGVVEEVIPNEVAEESAVDTGEAGESGVTEGAAPEPAQPADEATDAGDGQTSYPGAGEAAPAEEVVEAVPPQDGETAVAPESGNEAETAAPETTTPEQGGDAPDTTLGGVVDSGDPNVGGGIVEPGPADTTQSAESGEAPASAEETAATEETAAAGGQGGEMPMMALVIPGQPTQHIVHNQEWLTQLARCYGTTVKDIQAANNYACPDLIHPGWVVNIQNPGNAGPITINEMPCFIYYTVQPGNTLYSIAREFGIHYQWLARINAIYNYDFIYAGQILTIPNPVDPVFTTPPAQPYFYSNCWYGGCW